MSFRHLHGQGLFRYATVTVLNGRLNSSGAFGSRQLLRRVFPKNCCQIQITSSTLHLVHSLRHLHQLHLHHINHLHLLRLHYILYITFIICINFIYIASTIYNLHHLHRLHLHHIHYLSTSFTQSRSAQLLHMSYKTPTMPVTSFHTGVL